jgi:hypothetical protein
VGFEPSRLLETRKLFIPHPYKYDKNDRNAKLRYTAGTRNRLEVLDAAQ